MRQSVSAVSKRWIPVVFWMAAIFIFSTDGFAAPNTSSLFDPLLSWLIPGISAETVQMIHGMLRKFGHWAEYFILAGLVGRACQAQWPAQSLPRRFSTTFMVATLFAISDEWHQSFVPSRSASAVDVAIDACGAICGAFWQLQRQRIRANRGKTQQVGEKT